MRGLTIVVADASPMRLRTALGMLLSAQALGARAQMFLDGEAVRLLRRPVAAPEDAVHAAAGLPTLAGLVDEALDAGIAVTLCQSGMAVAGAEPGDYDPRVEYGGMVALLAGLGDDRLVAV